MTRRIEIAKGARRRPDPFARIEDAVAAIAAGRMVIVVDDEDRENEGDLTIAAEKVTPETINFIASSTLILIAVTSLSGTRRKYPDVGFGEVGTYTCTSGS